jgi:stage III sporulation protein AC
MDISLIIKVAGIGILVSVASQILSKSGRDEQSMLVTLAGIVVVLLLLVDEIALLFDRICTVFGFLPWGRVSEGWRWWGWPSSCS